MSESAFKVTDRETSEASDTPQHFASVVDCCGVGTNRYEILRLVITQVRRHGRREQSVACMEEKAFGNCLGGRLRLE
jgi:hypothetical protein